MDLYKIKWLKYFIFIEEKALFMKISGIKLPLFVNQVIID